MFKAPPAIVASVLILLMGGVSLAAQSPGKMVTYKGLEMSVAGVERAPTASLKDCPPGGNTVNATSRPGEEFVTVRGHDQRPGREYAHERGERAHGRRW